jgi:hypothetical protein
MGKSALAEHARDAKTLESLPLTIAMVVGQKRDI